MDHRDGVDGVGALATRPRSPDGMNRSGLVETPSRSGAGAVTRSPTCRRNRGSSRRGRPPATDCLRAKGTAGSRWTDGGRALPRLRGSNRIEAPGHQRLPAHRPWPASPSGGNQVAAPLAAGQTEHMQPSDIDFSNLTTAERIQLAEDLWDSVAAETGGLPLTAAQQAELDRRLADLERDPGADESWESARTRIERRLGKAE